MESVSKIVKIWLFIGLVMLFFQVVIGGVTRLTGSGLSITKWEIVSGTFPPFGEKAWEKEFDLYKATPQYKKINKGMSLSEFKFIYFWEYFHRLWARTMGFVFLIPFLIFLSRGMLPKRLVKRLAWVVLAAVLAASFGWIMVASGLNDRPWVSAYKLSIHLGIAFLTYSLLLWAFFEVTFPKRQVIHSSLLKKWGIIITILLAVQIIFGGWMSGMKAGIYYPTFPDMNGEFVPSIIFNIELWSVENFVKYDKTRFVPALVQFLHRGTAYLLTIIVLWYFYKVRKTTKLHNFRYSINMLVTMLVIQCALGIITVINCLGVIPVSWGVFHQAGALLFLTAALFNNYQYTQKSY